MNWHLAEPIPALVAHPVAASLDEAHAAIELWEYYSRKTLDGAQRLAVEHMLAEGDDGLWAASSTGRAESRQNGKGDEIEVVELWGLMQRGEAILHTAHEAATAASAHARLRDLIVANKDLRQKVGRNRRGDDAIQSWNGNYRIEMADDAFIVHRTRTAAIGRGLDDISRLVVDEAQHAHVEELASATPILAANPNSQKNYIGSAGVTSKSAFWWRLRRQSLLDEPGRFAWLEHSAEDVSLSDDGQIVTSLGDVNDRALWRRANPAYPSRISDDYLAGQLRDLGPEPFAREHLCVWDPEPVTASTIIPGNLWALCANPDATSGEGRRYSIDASPDLKSAAIAVSDGAAGVVLEHGPGVAWLPAKLAEIIADKPGDVWLDPRGPVSALLVALGEHGIEWSEVSAQDHAAACGGLLGAVLDGQFAHLNEPALNAAVAGATRRPYGDAWAWSRIKSTVDISPLVAVTIARWAALQAAEVKPDPAMNVW